MALTSQQITSLLQITQAMFNATPGKVYFNDLSSQLEAGNSIAMIAQAFLGTELFLGKGYSLYGVGNLLSETLIDDLVGDRASADNKTSAITFINSLVMPDSSTDQIVSEVIRIFSAFPVTDQNWGAAVLHYNTESANKVVNNLVADTVSPDVKASAVSAILAQMATGKTFGEAVVWATTTLDEIATTDPVWGNAARLFDNRIEVSRYYSIEKNGSSTHLPLLHQILSGITVDTISIATAKTMIDNLVFLAKLNGSNGFRLDGEAPGDKTGISVGGAGDINGDGFDDLIIGSPIKYITGNSYVVFGKASGFNAVLPLSSLDGTNGFRINGVALGDMAGQSVGSAGDINGDSIDDLIVGATNASTLDGEYSSGNAYVVFGKTSGFDANLDLSDLDGNNGFRMSLDESFADLGRSVSSAGDVNGDGIDDLIVGAPEVITPAGNFSGNSYVIFGKTSGFDASLNLSDLDGSNGFKIQGIVASARHGFSVSAGDINGDGFSDLISGSFNDETGTTYIVFGKASGFDAILDLANLGGVNGFSIEGESEGDAAGVSVDNAGDINGDGFDDVLIGSKSFDRSYDDSGAAYIVFGKASGFSSTIKLSELNGDDGFRLVGVKDFRVVGVKQAAFTGLVSVSTAGDFNGDGFDDLIIGAPNADHNGPGSGAAYVIFGKPSAFDSSINLANLNSSVGFIINGLADSEILGASVSSAGDINKDGFDDLIIGAPFGDGAAFYSGVSYVIFGRSTATPISSPESTQDMVNLVGVNQIIEAS